MNRVLLIILLVSILESHGDFAGFIDNKTINVSNDEPFNEEPSTESTTISYREDQDPLESSETIVYNRYQKPSSSDEDPSASEEDPEGPPDHAIPYSEHEETRNVPTKPRYSTPGEWAKPSKSKDPSLEFVPTKLYAQVRKTHTVRRLPRRKAIENAESEEEKENAARLREVVKNSKVNTVYTEEGYEDSAYDHAGHIRDADFHEGYARKLRERLNSKKKSGDDEDNDGEENAAERDSYAKIDPEEFKDYEDDGGRYETTTEYRADKNVDDGRNEWRKEVSPQEIAEKGIQKLQEDLEREVEEIERGVEIGKLEKGGENLAESRKNEDYDRREEKKGGNGKRKRPTLMKFDEDREDAAEKLRESQEMQNIENHSTTEISGDEEGISIDGGTETTTLKENLEKFGKFEDPSASYKYEVDGNSPYIESIDFQRAEETPTTVSYGQLFWDYFKTRLTTTQIPSILESTTVSPNFLQASLGGSANDHPPYSIYEEKTTSFPVIESEIVNPQETISTRVSNDSKFSKINEQDSQSLPLEEKNTDKFWQPIDSNESTTTARFPETYNDQETLFPSNLARNLDSKEESNKNFGSALFDPTLNLFMNRKPRYKIAIRHRSKKPTSTPSSQVSSTLNSINEAPIESVTTETLPFNDNYMKVLLHLKNENNAKNLRPTNDLQTNHFFPSTIQNNPIDLTIMKPPLPQNPSDVSYHNFLPHRSIDNRPTQSIHPSFSMPEEPRTFRTYPNPLQTAQRSTSTRERTSKSTHNHLHQSSSLKNDFPRPRETIDYLTGSGNRSKRVRNVLRPYRRPIGHDTIAGIRGKRRERRSSGWGMGVEGLVKGERASTSNGITNRRETDNAAKNSTNQRRNSSRKATREGRAGIPGEKPSIEKKSRSRSIDRGEGPLEGRVVKRESSAVGGDESEGREGGNGSDLKPLKRDEGEREEGEESAKEDKPETGFSDKKLHEELLEESPKLTDSVIGKEIDARFNEKEEDEEQGNREKDVEAEVPDFDYVEEFTEENVADNETTTEAIADLEKYPFYSNERLPMPSALKYAIDPGRIPRKTYGGMEFYGSRDAYKQCDEVEPELKVLPEKEEPVPDRGPKENQPRLEGLGDKLDCFKAKYFDEDPFDNPLFLEKEVEQPTPSLDLDTKRFASRIMMFPKQNDEFVIQKLSRRPENYRQPRRQSSSTARLQQSRQVRFKTHPRASRGRRPQVYRVQATRTKHVKASRPLRVVKRPLTSASDVSSMYTPYQSQVYEDVMGTIRNLASSYQVHEVTTTSSLDEVTVTVKTNEDVKTNVTANSTDYGKKDKDVGSTSIVERPSKVDVKIEGLTPPKYYNRNRTVYRRNRAPRITKTRMRLVQKPVGGIRVTRRRKVRVYKRDLRDEGDAEESTIRSDEVKSTEKNSEGLKIPLNLKESNNGGAFENLSNRTDSIIGNTTESVRRNLTASNVISRSKGKFKVPKSLSAGVSRTDKNQKKETSQKVVYTIRDRIRYSKPKGDTRRVGKFVNETEIDEDRRRKEPKYNYIRRRPSNSSSSTTETPSSDSAGEINWTESTIVAATAINEDIKENNKEFANENRNNQFLINDTKSENLNVSETFDPKEYLTSSTKQAATNRTGSGYAVYENVNEDQETTTPKPPSISSTESFNLKTFLETDPGHRELSSDEFKKSFFSSNNSNEFKLDFSPTNAKQTGNEEDDRNASKISDEESSERNAKIQSSTESSEESEQSSSKESNSEEDRGFFRYESRPSSPAENFEDEKYSDLGPRVNKPAFFHPPFSYSSFREGRLKGSSEEAADSNDEREYVFPWYRDKEDERKRKRGRYRGKSNGEYEYPWERRERLAREERRRNERGNKRLTKSIDDEEDAEEGSSKYRRNVYPRGRYRFWTGMNTDASRENESDNVESSSEYRPIMKYSSRYSSKDDKLPKNEKLVRSKSVQEISRSIKKALEDDSEETLRSKEKGRGISKGIVPEDVTLEPMRKAKEKSKISATSSKDVDLEGKNSTMTMKNGLEDSTVRTTSTKRNPEETVNSTRQLSKKRRRPSNNTSSVIETTSKTVSEANRARRRQKSGSTTPATITSTSVMSTTSASRVIRRRNQKLAKDSRRPGAVTANKSSNNAKNDTRTSTLKKEAMDSRSKATKRRNDKKKSPTNEKNMEHRETFVKHSEETKTSNKNNDDEKKSVENEKVRKKLIDAKEEADDNDSTKIEETSETKGRFPIKIDEKLDFKDDRMGSLSDYDKSDVISDDDDNYDDEFGGILKSDVNFKPENRAVQLSEQSSREIVTSVSWISENYNF